MRLFGEMNVLRGSIAWAGLLGPRMEAEPPLEAATPPKPEFDEDGRLYVFRFAHTIPEQRRIDFDRIFDYMKRRRLPSEAHRRFRRDADKSFDIHALPQ